MDWIRENKTQAAILGVFAAIVLGLGGFLYMANSDYGESLDKLQSVVGKVASQEKAAIYPSEANVKTLEGKIGEYEDGVAKLGGTLIALQNLKPVKEITDTDFQANLKTRINETKKKAASTTKLPKDFAFGFDIYTASLPRSQEAARDLNDYFESVAAVVDAALDAGVDSIDSLHRSELSTEKDKPAPAPTPAPSKAKSKTSSKSTKKGPAPKPVKPVAQVVERRQLTLQFTADQGAFQSFLNTLATPGSMPYFTIVRNLRVENERQEGPSSNVPLPQRPIVKEEKPSSKPADPNAKEEPKAEVIVAPKAEPPDAVMVIGGEKLKAHLEIDLVRFVNTAPETADAGSAK